MNYEIKIVWMLALFAVASFTGNSEATAQFEIASYSIDGGGGESVGGNFAVAGALGQPDAGESSGGEFSISGGFVDEPAALIGDVNGDGQVNLLDVSPFVDAIVAGEFLPAADINGDGVVNLLDVGPFVSLLSGN